MNVVVRTDASEKIGGGHLMRCLTLADKLAQHGATTVFVSRSLPETFAALVQERGHRLCPLTPADRSRGKADNTEDHSNWLGVDWQTDAQETMNALSSAGRGADLLIVDHYGIDGRWEAQVGRQCRFVMVIDDLADRTHVCDLLLDQNLQPGMHKRYLPLIPSECKMLLGPRYALLREEFLQNRNPDKPLKGAIRSILVFFGGADPHNLTPLTLRALKNTVSDEIKIDVIIGPANSRSSEIKSTAAMLERISIHDSVQEVAPLMAKADLCIGAGGSTSWERCCLGLPTIVVASSDAELQLAEHLQSKGIGLCVGSYRYVTESKLSEAIAKILADPSPLAQWSAGGMKLVDGHGAERVCRTLLEAVEPSTKPERQVRDYA
jgi:UDP-2,4-diacetamido-2,4,6-trideoxy-beta-L-altropyranose hydrolase